jgi:hypothetical protein
MVIGTPFHIECKKGKRTDIKAAMAQAGDDAAKRVMDLPVTYSEMRAQLLPPVAITKDDDKLAFVTMEFTDWIKMLEAIYGRRTEADSV